MNIENQTLFSPYYPQNYHGDGCEWLIIAPEGNKIFLEFNQFNVSKTVFIEFYLLQFAISDTLFS